MADPMIYTIPMDFYGGKNAAPAELGAGGIHAPAASTPAAASHAPQPSERQPILPPKPTLVQPAQRPASNMKWIIGGIVFVVIVLIGAAGFLFWQKKNQAALVPTPQPVVVVPPVTVPVEIATSTTEVATSTPVIVATSTVALIPAHVYKDSLDTDGDGLTNVEEEMWGTNPALIDSDSDGYPDRLELLNLYDPSVPSPARLVDSSLINSYINPSYSYTVYEPSAWIARAVDETTHADVLFSALSGEFVEILTLPFPTNQAFPDWFHQNFPNENLMTYQPFSNRFKVSGIMSPDKTVAFITDGSNVYLLRYDGGTREEINYRSTFLMMVQSFKPQGIATPFELLPQINLGAPTALGVIASTTPEIVIPEIASSTPSSTEVLVPLPFEVVSSTPASAPAATTSSTATSTP